MKKTEEFYFQWHFLNECNLRCKHCYQENYCVQNLPLDKLMVIAGQITDALRQWNMLGRLSLTGGEPFISPFLFDLAEYFDRHETIKQFDILTNGTLITDAYIDRLKQFSKLRQIQISLDGSDAHTHDNVRGIGVFDTVVNTIERLRSSGIEVSIMFTLMKTNQHNAVNVIDFCEAHNINAVTIERVTPCGQSEVKDILTADEIKNVYESIAERANTAPQTLKIRRLRPLWIKTIEKSFDKNNIGGFCPVGFTSLAILWDGTVLPCRRLNIPIGNLFKDGLYKTWYDSDLLWQIRDKNNLKGKCSGCSYIERCGGCRAIAYEVTGDYMEGDPQCWD